MIVNATTNTREQIIDTAFQLMLQHGYNGFSYRDISTPLGIRNAAIHYHFPAKTDLVRALIEENHEKLKSLTAGFMAYGGDARSQLEGLFEFTRQQCCKGRPICIVGALAVDYEDLPEDLKEANQAFMKDSMKWLAKVLEVGRDQGEFEFNGEATQKAMLILASIQGARQMARIHGDQVLENTFDQIRLDLGITT
jgi:AcrR family transcriptional regulator